MSDSDTILNTALDTLKSRIGQSSTASDWFEVTQDRIDGFAEVTMDHQWIHVDVEKAKSGPFGEPIAHEHLTLSIMGHLPKTEGVPGPKLDGQKISINYGFDKVRFPSPVTVGAKTRATSTLKRAEIKSGMIETMNEVVVEVEGQELPAAAAESLGRLVF